MAVKRVYEAMFLFDPTVGATWERVEEQVKRLMERAEAELIHVKKWDERRLTYEIGGRKRGVYVLAYFRAPTDKIVGMERDVQLSEEILRVLIVCRGQLTEEKLKEMVDKAIAYVPPAHHEGFGFDRGYDRGYDRGGGYDRDRGRDREGFRPRFDRDRAPEAEAPEMEEGGEEVPATK